MSFGRGSPRWWVAPIATVLLGVSSEPDGGDVERPATGNAGSIFRHRFCSRGACQPSTSCERVLMARVRGLGVPEIPTHCRHWPARADAQDEKSRRPQLPALSRRSLLSLAFHSVVVVAVTVTVTVARPSQIALSIKSPASSRLPPPAAISRSPAQRSPACIERITCTGTSTRCASTGTSTSHARSTSPPTISTVACCAPHVALVWPGISTTPSPLRRAKGAQPPLPATPHLQIPTEAVPLEVRTDVQGGSPQPDNSAISRRCEW